MTFKKINKHVVSKQRVTDHGEVFTLDREVNAMLDLVKQETVRIDSRFLEPACGNGNFLAEILRRKLEIVKKRYSKSQIEYERYSILALSSIYGVEILEDNVKECRERILGIFVDTYLKYYRKTSKIDFVKAAEFVINRNILWGDALSLKTPDKNAEPIVFSEWSLVKGNLIKRRDFKMSHLLEYQPFDGPSLFSDLGEDAFIPMPIKDYPLINFLELGGK